MVAIIYGVSRIPAAEPAAKAARAEVVAPRNSWFARFMDALIESRMEQARRELRLHARLLPYAFDEQSDRVLKTGADNLPFGD